jgi:DNA-binding MarR family transcriptional regulator
MTRKKTTSTESTVDTTKIAEFLMFSQREFLLNLSVELTNEGISFIQYFLLSYLETTHEMTMSEVAKKMGHSTAAATGLVDRLEKMDLMIRSVDEKDRRKVSVKITNNGLQLVKKLRVKLEDLVKQSIHDDNPDQSNVLKILHMLS